MSMVRIVRSSWASAADVTAQPSYRLGHHESESTNGADVQRGEIGSEPSAGFPESAKRAGRNH
jgi:hypothetical protein